MTDKGVQDLQVLTKTAAQHKVATMNEIHSILQQPLARQKQMPPCSTLVLLFAYSSDESYDIFFV